MRHADRALMMLYRNEVNGTYEDDLVERMKWMMTEQCVVCTQPGWENLKAKITIMVEGSCEMGNGCGKLSMCAKDTSSYPDSNGAIRSTTIKVHFTYCCSLRATATRLLRKMSLL
mmetsp:Transcript_17515/g.14893  ORF Transcript_17515/g.14893 Transcript_17515/m.14893 type:complete len:115 (+) Transcript_17515:178-522(+)